MRREAKTPVGERAYANGAWRDLRAFSAVGLSAVNLTMAFTLALATGASIAIGQGLLALVLIATGMAIIVGLVNWRWSVYGLVAYLPFSGIAILATYPSTASAVATVQEGWAYDAAVLLKDLLFVVPAYLGFLVYHLSHRRPIGITNAPVMPMVMLALIVLAQVFNPALPSLLVGLIGAKVWLFYIPLFFLGYHLVERRRDVVTLLSVMVAASVVPLVLGVVEALLLNGGRADFVYGLYGDAAGPATQNLAEIALEGGGIIRRVPSTFSFVTQYFVFTAAMVALSYGLWRSAPDGQLRRLGQMMWPLALVAALSSGARVAFVLIPVLVGLLLLLDARRRMVGLLSAPVVLGFALIGVVAALGATVGTVSGHIAGVALEEFPIIVVEGFRSAISETWVGLGAGIDTSAARHAFPGQAGTVGINGVWQESWYVKVIIELGVGGAVAVALLFGGVIRQGFRAWRMVDDRLLKGASTGMLAFLLWILLANIKGQYLDLDPANVYFWLIAGVLAKLPVLGVSLNARGG